MKKIIALCISVALIIVSSTSALSAESDVIISGLDEQLDEILLNSDANSETRLKIQESYSDYLERLVVEVMQNPDFAKEKMGVITGDDDYEAEQIRHMFTLDMDKGVLIRLIDTSKYALQYAQMGHFSYLFNKEMIFMVPGIVRDGRVFSTNGKHLVGSEYSYIYQKTPTVVTIESIVNYLNNRELLKDELLKKGETIVKDVVLCGYGYLTLLYIKCDNNEYLVRLYESSGDVIPEIEPYVLYTAEEVMNAFDDLEVKNSPYSQGLAEMVLAKKSTFETEALSLQKDGLLLGNENGLDLLKPLTRIEAATMLLRALGESTKTEATVQTFADVPESHWGHGAAENAYSLGLIKGVGDDLFAPDDPVTGPQFATMILRAGNHADFNWEEALDILVAEGIISAEDAETMDFFTRGDMAKIIYESIGNGLF